MTSYYLLVPLVLILLLALFAMTNEYTNLESSLIVQWTPVDELRSSSPSSPIPQSLRTENSTENETAINPKFTKTKKVTSTLTSTTSTSTTSTSTTTTTSTSTTQTTAYSYDARLEIEKRRDHLKLWCKERDLNPGFRSMSFRTGYVSKWGKSLGGVNFWTCFTPKCASSSFSVAVLAATGIIYRPYSPWNPYLKRI